MKLDKVAVLDNKNIPVTEKHLQRMRQAVPGCEFIVVNDGTKIDQLAHDADALILWPSMKPEVVSFCKKAPNLKWLHLFIAGVDMFLQSEAGRINRYRLSCTKGIHGYPISEHVLSYLLAATRQLPASLGNQAKRVWDFEGIGGASRELSTLTAGVIGLGGIGLEVARKCKLMDMTVIGLKRTPIESQWLDECLDPAGLDRLLEKSDFVILCLPLTDKSRHLIGRREFKRMKKGAWLVNIARGGVVDQDALVEALGAQEIAGAALDVTEPEPLPADSPLWSMNNVIITPHTAAQSPQYMDRAIEIIVANLIRYVNDQPLLFEVNREEGY